MTQPYEAIEGAFNVDLTPDLIRAIRDRTHPLAQVLRFDPATSIFNLKATNTRRSRAALGLARADVGLCRIAFPGDSVTAGYLTTRGTQDPVTRLRQYLVKAGFRTGELVHFYANMPEPRPVTTGTAAVQGITSGWLTYNAASTWTMTGTGRYMELVSSNQSTAWSYQIDGGASVPVTTTGAATYKVQTIDLGTDAAHTFKVTMGAGAAFWFSAGFRSATGIVVENAGVSGAKASDFLTASLGKTTVMTDPAYFDIDIAVIELSANERNNGIPVATARTSLLANIDKWLASGADVYLVATHTPTSVTDWQPYVDMHYELAALRDIPLLDLSDRFGWGATGSEFDGTAYDVSVDGGHLTVGGNSMKAMAWADLLRPGLGIV